ncbi:hypothetical protein, partial [Citreimonas sp.]|uniref:hypothetical protein n=1 Tax=Citreimonas sp. TaxID=3036715 RepID=UPI0035C7A6A7
MFHEGKDPITRVALGIIATAGVVLLIIAGWSAFFASDPVAENEPVTEQVAEIDVDSIDDENVSDPLPQDDAAATEETAPAEETAAAEEPAPAEETAAAEETAPA